jgi:hypothetical protein
MGSSGGGGGGGSFWQGTTPAPAQAPASSQSQGAGFYQGPGMWLPDINGQALNIPQSQATPSSGGLYQGWGPNQFTTHNPVQGMMAPQAPQAPQALLNSIYNPQQGAAVGMGGQGSGMPNQGMPGQMSTYQGGQQGASQWWAPSGRMWGT